MSERRYNHLQRSRAYKKNDSCYVEQKNYTAVRQYVGYFRYDTKGELNILNNLYRYLSLYLNYFHPLMKLKKKERIGSKVKKTYDKPKTPYQMVLDSPDVTDKNKEKLKRIYAHLNPAELVREIEKLQRKLFKIATSKKKTTSIIAYKGQRVSSGVYYPSMSI